MTTEFKYESCEKAAQEGDVEELKKMHLSGMRINISASFEAATNGHLACLKYVHKNTPHLRWDSTVTLNAAKMVI